MEAVGSSYGRLSWVGAGFEESGGVHNRPIITLASDHRKSRDMSRATSKRLPLERIYENVCS